MRFIGYLFSLSSLLFLLACSGNTKLVDKSKTKDEVIRWYVERAGNGDTSIKKFYASVTRNEILSFYSFYPGKIIKATDTSKAFSFTVFYGVVAEGWPYYQKFTTLDSMILAQGDHMIDSLGLNFRKSEGASAFQMEVNWYHGYPKNKKLAPY